MTQVRIVRGRQAGAVALIAALAVAGCTSSGTTPSQIASAIANASLPPIQAPVPSASSEPPSSAPASEEASGTPEPTAVATDLDPCQLVTADDASAFVGVKFGAGKASTSESNVRTCTYAAPGPNLFMVEVAIAPDVATAKAAEASVEDDLKSSANDLASLGLSVTKLPNFAPGTDAATMQGALSESGMSVAARAMLLLRATTFLAFSDVAVGGGKPPSDQAFKDEANALLAKLP
jgi:hypothetical protein